MIKFYQKSHTEKKNQNERNVCSHNTKIVTTQKQMINDKCSREYFFRPVEGCKSNDIVKTTPIQYDYHFVQYNLNDV